MAKPNPFDKYPELRKDIMTPLEKAVSVVALLPVPVIGEACAAYTLNKISKSSSLSAPARIGASIGAALAGRLFLYSGLYEKMWNYLSG